MPRQLFPYVGGKYLVAPKINRRFGEIDTRIDAFTGSSSWILASPPVKYEIVNDLDGYVVNYLRAVKYAPDEIARHLDFPRAELELIAYHHYTRDKFTELVARLGGDPEYYDPVIAARWAYVMAHCVMYEHKRAGGWLVRDGRLVYERGAGRRRGSMASTPQLLAQLVKEHRVSEYVAALSERLRNVWVMWNDFEVVVGKANRHDLGVVGILLDPPYPRHLRDFDYDTDSEDIWHRAARWAIANGDNPKYRIAVCGYNDAESDALFPPSWSRLFWRRFGLGRNKDKECVWFSPHCGGGRDD
jgi:site-specific DNA-adenine methylase